MTEELEKNVTSIRGIGEETASMLATMGIHTVEDLLTYYPFRFEDQRLKDLAEVDHDEKVTVEGSVMSAPSLTFYGRNKSRLAVRVMVGSYLVTAVFFNRPYLKKKLQLNTIVTLSGKWNRHRQQIIVNEVKFGKANHVHMTEFQPFYSVKGDLTSKGIHRFIRLALTQYFHAIEETIPTFLLEKYRLLPRKEAIRAIHFPKNAEEIKQARRRLVYEEFLQFQLKIQALRKIEREKSAGAALSFKNEPLKMMIQSLPFPLTTAQKRVLKEILYDLRSPYRMNRLLQGDVGSGKTVVAAIALFATALSGYQGALMVPTEILAEQHAESIEKLLSPFSVEIALLTGSVKGKRRKEIQAGLEDGRIQIIIGTHALIQEDIQFSNLGLVITDEQHRFGVEQRRILREKGVNPNTLIMTATPIPRTLAITAFGELDISVIDEMPAGRKRVKTYWAKPEMLEQVLSMMERELKKGRQAYVICPLIEESEKLDVQNAIDVHASLVQFFRHRFKIGLMHGRLSPEEKEAVMRDFSENNVHVLVSTTVVEVGVNVPNASMMVIYDAERFGLAQLHQLRGRVGRGNHQSYCILLADPKSETGKERMRIMTETYDGFLLSEKDLKLRGPGDFFGKKQSGLPDFKIADMVHDYRALEVARKDAEMFIQSDEFWTKDEFSRLRRQVEQSGILDGKKLD
ncbi:ATP-dependent DNA helicase RecG [Fervidibacillus halotolerans]|uniref:ATP-dependent DNA helicase RecG n=1 Tax=Fervidibacillus halotolerans TaxID=2980027 RepID=A0A9E8M183_9BACI|nr:ATP-dependent DNA helicase RecG [Fervidibacillus halotolerans]WAA13643.1 ATP-dependent DNA helicase RecG [Fervidibacillus halotolerans]